MYPRSLGVFLALGAITIGNAAPPDPSVFETTTWAEAPMLTNPTSISFDTEGRLYVAEPLMSTFDLTSRGSWKTLPTNLWMS